MASPTTTSSCEAMVKIRLRYLVEDVDRHGNVRLYVRIKGRPKVRIDEVFGTEAFLEKYE